MITALLLDLAGVPVDSIVEDYLVSVVIMNDYHGRHQPDVEPILQGEALQAWMLKVGDHLRQFLRERPCAEFLTQCGFSPGELETVKGRLI